jgi:phosphoenolpyruvate carboxykinase (GTP)
MAMLPFCGYHMGDYFTHWLEMGQRGGDKMPQIFYVNWFRKGSDGKFLWPGYGENSRVLKWVFERADAESQAVDSPIGFLPAPGALDIRGLDLPASNLNELLNVDKAAWQRDLPAMRRHFETFGAKFPQGLWDEFADLERRLTGA